MLKNQVNNKHFTSMAWLSGLAGKAETLLNKIDKNTAAALSKDKLEIEPQSVLTEVTWVPPPS